MRRGRRGSSLRSASRPCAAMAPTRWTCPATSTAQARRARNVPPPTRPAYGRPPCPPPCRPPRPRWCPTGTTPTCWPACRRCCRRWRPRWATRLTSPGLMWACMASTANGRRAAPTWSTPRPCRRRASRRPPTPPNAALRRCTSTCSRMRSTRCSSPTPTSMRCSTGSSSRPPPRCPWACAGTAWPRRAT